MVMVAINLFLAVIVQWESSNSYSIPMWNQLRVIRVQEGASSTEPENGTNLEISSLNLLRVKNCQVRLSFGHPRGLSQSK